MSLVDDELMRAVPSYGMRRVLWSLAERLAQSDAPAPERRGSYKLLRWPDASGLTVPGHPRLAALWTSRAFTLEQIHKVSGVPEANARWFLEACLALGTVDTADNDPSDESTRTGAMKELRPPTLPARVVPVSWFGNLRERLKLW